MRFPKLVIASALLFTSTLGMAMTYDNVTMPDQLTLGGRSLILNGMGIRKASFLKVKVYVAGLYLEQKTQDAIEILDSHTHRHLELVFLRDVTKEKLVDAWTESFKNNCEPDCRRLEPFLSKLTTVVGDVRRGDKVVLDFFPSHLQVQFNHHAGQRIESPAFGRVILSSWLGPKPPNTDLKEGLLGLLKAG